MNLTVKPTVDALSVKTEGASNPCRMVKIELRLSTSSDTTLEEMLGPALAHIAVKAHYRKLQPLIPVGTHDLVMDAGSMRVRAAIDIHELEPDGDGFVAVTLRCAFPLETNSAAMLHLAGLLGDEVEIKLEAAQQDLPGTKPEDAQPVGGVEAITLHTAGGKSVTAPLGVMQAALDEFDRRKASRGTAA